MRTIEVIDNIQMTRGRYFRPEGGFVGGRDGGGDGGGSPRRAGTIDDLSLSVSEGGGGAGGGDGASFAGSDLERDLEREYARRSVRKAAKRIAVVLALGAGLLALAGRRRGGGLLFSLGRVHGGGGPPEIDGEGGAAMDDGAAVIDDDGSVDDLAVGSAAGGEDGEDGDDDPFPINNDDDYSGDDDDDDEGEDGGGDEAIETVEEGAEEIESLAALFHAAQALPPFDICPPPLERDRTTQDGDAVFHIGEFRIVPEGDDDDGEHSRYEYTLSDMDVSDEASIIALGMGDYAADTGYAVGMVRAYAYSCESKEWRRLGQDLLGEHENEMFGHRVSSNRDGRVMAVSGPQRTYAGGSGFVEVYSLDETTGRWEVLGSRIDSLPDAEDDYYMLGHAVDISDKGETLAVLGIVDDEFDNPSYVTRVFDYDYRKKEWLRKGHDLVIANVTFGRDYAYEYSPQVSLSDKGDKLIVTDPQMGVVEYHFHFGLNHWKSMDSRTPSWNDDAGTEYWIESLDLDDRGKLIAFSAFEEEEDGVLNAVKIVDFQGDSGGDPVDVYARDFRGWRVDLSVAVSDTGNAAAFVASKIDEDDADWWFEYELGDYDYEIVGALTVVTKYDGDEAWSVVGKGTEAENLGVSGRRVSLSGDGQIAAVGYDTVVSLYGISLDRPSDTGATGEAGAGTTSEVGVATPTAVNICTPFPDASDDGPLGFIDDLPKTKEGEEQHTLSLSLSEDGSIVAVGMDSFDGEDRGLVRTFAWSCDDGRYVRLGQDLLGSHEFDGFGQAVDLSADGRSLAVGANQPPPGKSGYVDVYELDGNWKVKGHRIKKFPKHVSDIGRGVHLSNDGQTLMILGSIMSGHDYDSSFIRVVHLENGKWVAMGEDILSSVQYDDCGISAHATLSGDGNTMAVTGSYSQFFAKLYRFDEHWTETVIPPLTSCIDDPDIDSEIMEDDYGFDYNYECSFTGEDIAINSEATFLAVAGTSYESSGGEIGTVRVLAKDPETGNFTLGENPIDFSTDYFVSSVDISDDGQHLAVGINDHSGDLEGQGQGVTFVAQSAGGWMGMGKVDGTKKADLLGARVRISGNGQLAAATSRRGYISFFKA